MLTKLSMLAMAAAVFFVPGSVLDTAQQTEMVTAHNRWRKEVGAPALKWSTSLALSAQTWAEQLKSRGCNMVHSGSPGLGENLYWASAVTWSSGRTEEQAVSPADVVSSWAKEKENYSYQTDSCARGQMCGHYTQVVWDKTTEVGCARAICSDKSQVWVCNYKPQGNIIGQRPY